MLKSIVLEGMLQDNDSLKTVHHFSRDKVTLVVVKIASKNFENSRYSSRSSTSSTSENVALCSKGGKSRTLAKTFSIEKF